MAWADIEAKLDGRILIRHAVLTYAGTWAPPGVGYCSDVVNGVAQFIDDGLFFEVPVPYPASFGPIGGAIASPSYQQSITNAIAWTADWLASHPNQTFATGGYSQGAEAASRVVMELMSGSLQQYLPNFIGGYTYGNPSRGQGFHAPTIADPGGHGISATLMTELPRINGQVVWADYVHSPNNGDAGKDMYASVPAGQVGKDMTDIYGAATNMQFNDLGGLTQMIVTTLISGVNDLNLMPAIAGGLPGIIGLGMGGMVGLFTELLAGPQANATPGASAAVQAALEGMKFLAAPGGPTAPHVSYGGEIGGYSNLVDDAMGFLTHLAALTPPRA